MEVLQTNHKIVQSESNNKLCDFSINVTGKMFEILSSKIYKYKIKAPVRELSTNAIDSHKMAGQTKPFEVHIPTTYESFFRIRDYGIGMSKEFLIKNYTQYGLSDKNHSNDLIGGFGLGSKSPLAYTKAFTVTSYHNGTKYLCVVSIGEKNIPQLLEFTEVPTNEPNGVEIEFAVNRNDIAQFQLDAKEIYSHFENFLPKSNIPLTKVQYVFRNEIYGIPQNKGRNSMAIMGNVAYDIDYTNFESKYHKLLSKGYHYFFGIGDVDITVSREEVEYSRQTIKAVKERLDKVLLDAEKKLISKIGSLPSLVQAFRLVNNNDEYKDYYELLGGNVNFNGFNLSGTLDNKTLGKWQDDFYVTYFTKYTYRTKVDASTQSTLALNSEIIIDDNEGKKSHVICKELVLNKYNDGQRTSFSLLKISSEKLKELERKKILVADDYQLLSTLYADWKVRNAKDKKDRIKGTVYSYKRMLAFDPDNIKFIEKDIDESKGGYIVQIKSYNWQYRPSIYNNNNLSDLVNLLKKLTGNDDFTIVGCTPTAYSKMVTKGWEPFEVAAERLIKANLSKEKFDHFFNLYCNDKPSFVDEKTVRSFTSFSLPNCTFKNFCDSYIEYINFTKKNDKYLRTLRLHSNDFKIPINHKVNWLKSWESIVKQYPILKEFSFNYYTTPSLIKEIVKYIWAVETVQDLDKKIKKGN